MLGVEPVVEPDCWELDLEPGSRLLLCSDGLTNELDEQDIAKVLLDEADTDKAAEELVQLALQRGGIDNVTVVVLDVLAGESEGVTDDVVVIPAVIPGTPLQAREAEMAPITEVVAVTPTVTAAAAAAKAPVPPARKAAVPAVGAAPRAPRGRPMVLVPAPKRRKGHRDRIFTIRVALFVLVFVGVLGSTAGVVVWFDKASFFVGLDHGYVTIFQGRPGGLLWIEPSVVERTTITPAELLSSNVVYLRLGMEESSYQAARNLVHSLALEHLVIVPSESTTTTTIRTTMTTVQKK